ncbi:DUF2848 family protein [Propionivibrio sp.]|uniref:DUF2848 family protein n=1 Tax=Propionivibrio sp. TaxID=2212460 RepID=UPI0039E51D71
MKRMWFDVIEKDGSSLPTGFAIRHACLYGWAGRNQEEVKKHAAELAAHGIRGPKNMPEYFIISPCMMTQGSEITCVGEGTCGEIEFFFFVKNGEVYVGTGSEHTDRDLEAVDMIKSKAICEKVMSRQLWRYRDVREHWDQLQLTAWQTHDGVEMLYQDSPLEALLPLDNIMGLAQKMYGSLEDVIVWSGTIPTLGGLVYGNRFRGRLHDPVLNRELAFDYAVRVVPADK